MNGVSDATEISVPTIKDRMKQNISQLIFCSWQHHVVSVMWEMENRKWNNNEKMAGGINRSFDFHPLSLSIKKSSINTQWKISPVFAWRWDVDFNKEWNVILRHPWTRFLKWIHIKEKQMKCAHEILYRKVSGIIFLFLAGFSSDAWIQFHPSNRIQKQMWSRTRLKYNGSRYTCSRVDQRFA